MLPMNILLVRHGESEANKLVALTRAGDDSLYTEAVEGRADGAWRLTAKGREQARAIGEQWVMKHYRSANFVVSPYARALETAGLLGLPESVEWEILRCIREGSWGDISTIPRSAVKAEYARNWKNRHTDKLHWTPPSGESILGLSEGRVELFMEYLRKSEYESLVAVTHSMFMEAFAINAERWTDADYYARHQSSEFLLNNCSAVEYRTNGVEFVAARRIHLQDGCDEPRVTPWRYLSDNNYSSSQLLTLAAEHEVFFE